MSGCRRFCSPERFILISLRRRSRTARQGTLRPTKTANWTWTIERLAVFAGKGCPGPQRAQL